MVEECPLPPSVLAGAPRSPTESSHSRVGLLEDQGRVFVTIGPGPVALEPLCGPWSFLELRAALGGRWPAFLLIDRG